MRRSASGRVLHPSKRAGVLQSKSDGALVPLKQNQTGGFGDRRARKGAVNEAPSLTETKRPHTAPQSFSRQSSLASPSFQSSTDGLSPSKHDATGGFAGRWARNGIGSDVPRLRPHTAPRSLQHEDSMLLTPSPPGPLRAFVCSNYPAHNFGTSNKHTVIMVDVSSQRAQSPYTIKVLVDLRAFRDELPGKRAYLVAYDAERLTAIARGCGMDARTASGLWIAYECLCAEKIQLHHLREEVALDIKPSLVGELGDEFSSRGFVALLRVALVPNHKPLTFWRAIGDLVTVRLSNMVGKNSLPSEVTQNVQTETDSSLLQPSYLVGHLCQYDRWWDTLVPNLEDGPLLKAFKAFRDAVGARGLLSQEEQQKKRVMQEAKEGERSKTKELQKLKLAAEEEQKLQKEVEQQLRKELEEADLKYKLDTEMQQVHVEELRKECGNLMTKLDVETKYFRKKLDAEKENFNKKLEEVKRKGPEGSGLKDSGDVDHRTQLENTLRHEYEEEFKRKVEESENARKQERSKDEEVQKLKMEVEVGKGVEELLRKELEEVHMKYKLDAQTQQVQIEELEQECANLILKSDVEKDNFRKMLDAEKENFRTMLDAEKYKSAKMLEEAKQEAELKMKTEESENNHKQDMAEEQKRAFRAFEEAREAESSKAKELQKLRLEVQEERKTAKELEQRLRRELEEANLKFRFLLDSRDADHRTKLQSMLRQDHEEESKRKAEQDEKVRKQKEKKDKDALEAGEAEKQGREQAEDGQQKVQEQEMDMEMLLLSEERAKRRFEAPSDGEDEQAKRGFEAPAENELEMSTHRRGKKKYSTYAEPPPGQNEMERGSELERHSRHVDDMAKNEMDMPGTATSRRSGLGRYATYDDSGAGVQCTRTRLRVTIMSAKGLPIGDIGGKSDPYCICEIMGRKEARFQTDVVKQTLEPVWQQEHIFEACALTDDLLFQVYDHDAGKTLGDFLGEAVLDGQHFRPDGFDGHLVLDSSRRASLGDLFRRKSQEPATLAVKVEVLPMAPGSAAGPRLFVQILQAECLRAADFGGKSDPFCICWIPGKPASRFRTKTIKKSLNPHWAEEAEVTDFEPGDKLEFEVFDHDFGKDKGDPLGALVLESDDFFPHGFTGHRHLAGVGAGRDATLTVRIDVVR